METTDTLAGKLAFVTTMVTSLFDVGIATILWGFIGTLFAVSLMPSMKYKTAAMSILGGTLAAAVLVSLGIWGIKWFGCWTIDCTTSLTFVVPEKPIAAMIGFAVVYYRDIIIKALGTRLTSLGGDSKPNGDTP